MTWQIDSVSATHLFNYYQLTRFSPRQVFGQLEGNKPAELYLLSFVDDAQSAAKFLDGAVNPRWCG